MADDAGGGELVPAGGAGEIVRLAAEAADYAAAALAASTRRAYGAKWRAFCVWCADRCLDWAPADPDWVLIYVTELARTRSISTIGQTLAAIAWGHREKGFAPPTSARLDQVLAGVRRSRTRSPRRVAPLLTADLRKLIGKIPADVRGARDKALLLVGFAGALRRSELVALQLDESALIRCEFVRGGLRISLGRSKTDQDGRGQVVAIPRGKTRLCPVAALEAWLELAQIRAGHVFRGVDRHGRVAAGGISDRAAADIIKARCSAAGLDPTKFSGHSLRAGFVTQAAIGGASTELIMRQTRHRRAETVAVYVREVDLFSRNAAGKVGL